MLYPHAQWPIYRNSLQGARWMFYYPCCLIVYILNNVEYGGGGAGSQKREVLLMGFPDVQHISDL